VAVAFPAPRHAPRSLVGAVRNARLAVRLALATALAIPAGLGLTLAGAEPAEAAGCVYFSSVKFNATGDDTKNLNGEWVKVTNRCATTFNIGGWRVKDRAGNTYTFASPTRMGTGSIYLHTGKGTNRPGHRYWRRSSPVWNNTGTETAYLLNKSGTIVHRVTRVVSSGSSSGTSAWSTAFGSRPRSGAISLRDCRDRTISNKTFKDLGTNVIAIRLVNCHNVTIKAVDFINVAEGVYAVDSTNIKIIDSRYQNITGPSDRTGANTGNFVQFHRVSGGLIDHNKGKGGDTEDVVSLYKSSHIVVEDNHFEGTNWTSTSGSGIAIGDGGGSDNIARRNKLVNIGQVGIFIAGGRNNRIRDNIIIGQPRTNSNVGIYVRNSTSTTCSGHAVTGNKVRFQKANGTRSGYWQGSGCGTVTRSGNDWWAPLDISRYRVNL
jgi:Lamin Tail Domain/Right handed beta helix region